MEVVIDTNCLVSALVISGKSRELICSLKLILYAPEDIISECLEHKKEIIDKSGINELEFAKLIDILLFKIHVVPESEFKQFKEQALKLVTHPEDSPFMALALAKNIPLWSDDKALKQQSKVKVFSTSELIKELGL